jgi:RNA polymerase sigma factor (sigma-70 family)
MSLNKAGFTDSEFIAGLRAGDDLVLKALYKKYYTIVLKLVVNNSGSYEEAKDVYQETVIVLFECAQKPEFILKCQLQTFVYSIAKRLWLKQLRRHGQFRSFRETEETELEDVSTELSVHLEKERELKKMASSLDDLGEPCKSILQDFYINRMSMDEISSKFGYTNSDNAKNQKYKCLQRLKKSFFEGQNE